MIKPIPLKLLALLLLVSPCLYGQGDIWTLDRCLEYAKKNNIQIQQQKLEVQRSEINLRQSRMLQLPDVNASASYGKNYGRSIDPTTNQFISSNLSQAGGSLNAGITLFNFFQIRNTIRANKLNTDAGRKILESMTNDVFLNVANAYLQILLADEQLKIVKDQLKLTKEQYNNTQKQVRAGVLPESNESDLLAQIARDTASIVDNQIQFDNAILQIKVLLNLDFEKPFIPSRPDLVSIPLLDLEKYSAQDIFLASIQHNPGILADSLSTRAAGKTLQASKASLYPTLSFGAQFGTNYSNIYRRPIGEIQTHVPPAPIGNVTIGNNDYIVNSLPQDISTPRYEDPAFLTQLNDNLRESIGLTLSIPLFDRGQTRSQIKNSEIDLKSRELTLKNDLQVLKQDIYTAYFQADAALKTYNAAKETLKASEKSFFYAQKRYEVGIINSIEFLTSQNDLFQAQTDLVIKHYDYIFKMKVLEFYKDLHISLE